MVGYAGPGYAAGEFCTPDTWRTKTFKPSGAQGRLMQPSIVADDDFKTIAVIWYQSDPPGFGPTKIEPQGRLSTDGGKSWSNPLALTMNVGSTSQDLAYQPCPKNSFHYGDYIGTTFVPYDPLGGALGGKVGLYELSAWTDSRGGCDGTGEYDHHVQATLW